MAYKIDSQKFFLSLEIKNLGPNEGDKALSDFKKAVIGKFDLMPQQITILVELIKNIIDHSDKGCLFLRRLDDGSIEFSAESLWPSSSFEYRKTRRPSQNFSIGMQIMTALCLDKDYAVVSDFSASCSLGKTPREREHNFSGRFMLDGDKNKNAQDDHPPEAGG